MPGPFDNYAQPWVPTSTPFAEVDDLSDVGPVAFNVADYPTEEALLAEIEAERTAPQVGSIFEPVVDVAAREEGTQTSPSDIGFAPVWTGGQMSPEAEAELTGVRIPPESYSQDLTQRQDGFEGAAPVVRPSFGADISLDPSGVISPESTPLTDDEIEGVPGVEAVPVQDLTDEALAMRRLEMDQAVEARRRELERDEVDKATARKLRDAQTYEDSLAKANQRTEELLTRSHEIGNQSVDNKRWFNDRSAGSQIGIALSVLAGGQLGLLSGRGGNEALDFFQGMIDRDIETQKFNIQKGVQDLSRDKGLVATLYEQTGDLNQAADAARLASFEAGIAKIDGEIAKMDPEGTQALEMETQKRQLRAQADAQRAGIAAQIRGNAMAEAKLNIEMMDKQSAIEKRDAEIRKIDAETAKASRRGSGKREDVYPVEYFKQVYGVDVPYQMSLKDFDDYNKRRKTVGELSGTPDLKEAAEIARAEGEATKIEREVGADSDAVRDINTGKPMVVDGEVWRHEKAGDAADIMEVTQNITRATDEIARLRKKSGGNLAALKSDDWQRLQALTRQIDFENAVALKLGALSEGDLKELVAFRGGVDPNSQVFDALAGLEQMGKSITDKANTRMRKLGWTGGRWEPARKASAVSREKSKPEVASDILNTSSFEFKDPGEVFADRKEQIDVFLEKDPSLKEMQDLASKLGNLKAYQPRSGEAPKQMLSQDQIYDLAAQMRDRYEELKTTGPNKGKALSASLEKQISSPTIQSPEDFYNTLVRGE